MTIIIRCVQPNGDIKKRFLSFIPIEEHALSYLEKTILNFLSRLGVEIKQYSGQ